MSTWRIHKRYGRGVARVVLCPLPYRTDLASLPLLDELRRAGPGVYRAARSGILLISILTLALLVTVGRERQDASRTQVFVMRDSPSVPLPDTHREPLPTVPKAQPEVVPPRSTLSLLSCRTSSHR